MNTVTYNKADFVALKAALEVGKRARVRVGILGENAKRVNDANGMNNPTLGAVHEFGSKTHNIPARSFLRVPLTFRLPAEVDKIGREVWRALVLKRGLTEALKALGVLAESIVQRGFETGGYGKWAPWSRRYAREREMQARVARPAHNGKAGKGFIGPIRLAILIKSGELRQAITSRVVLGNGTGKP